MAHRGQFDSAIAQYQQALEENPDYAEAHNNLGIVLSRIGRFEEALAHYRRVLELKPQSAVAHYNLGGLLADCGEITEALAHFRQAVELKPAYAKAHYKLSWLQATCPLASLRNGAEAIEHAVQANRLCEGRQPEVLDALAAAYAEAGRFPEAAAIARKALELARHQDDQPLVDALRTRIARYESGKPYRQTPLRSVPSPGKP